MITEIDDNANVLILSSLKGHTILDSYHVLLIVNQGDTNQLITECEQINLHCNLRMGRRFPKVIFFIDENTPKVIYSFLNTDYVWSVSRKSRLNIISKIMSSICDVDTVPMHLNKFRGIISCNRLNLTKSEVRALKILMDGRGIYFWAENLDVSVKTLYSQRRSVMLKTGIVNYNFFAGTSKLIDYIIASHGDG